MLNYLGLGINYTDLVFVRLQNACFSVCSTDEKPASFFMSGCLVVWVFLNRTAVKTTYNYIHSRFASNERENFLLFKGPTYKLKARELGIELGV